MWDAASHSLGRILYMKTWQGKMCVILHEDTYRDIWDEFCEMTNWQICHIMLA